MTAVNAIAISSTMGIVGARYTNEHNNTSAAGDGELLIFRRFFVVALVRLEISIR